MPPASPNSGFKVAHVGLLVRDMDGAIELFCGRLGMRLVRRKPGVAYKEVAMVEDGTTGYRIELLLDELIESTRLDHIAYETEDVDHAFGQMIAQGFSSDRPPFDLAGGRARTSFVCSPDGLKIEIIHYDAS